MTEKINTPQKDTFDPSDGNPFIGETEFEKTLKQRSRYYVDTTPPESHTKKPLSTKEKAPLAAVASGATVLAGLGVAVAPEMIDTANGPEFSKETTTHTVTAGEGWWDVAGAVDGSDTVDRNLVIDHIQGDPANIELLNHDSLMPGDSIVIPVSVEQ